MSFLWSLGSFIIAIAVLVAVHEYGHFWAARKCGIKFIVFRLAFGKVIGDAQINWAPNLLFQLFRLAVMSKCLTGEMKKFQQN